MDIYAVGAVFYEMVTGEKPSEGSDRKVEDDLKLPSQMGIQIDKNLENMILKALAVKPELRFQTAKEFLDCIIQNKKVLSPKEELKSRARKKVMKFLGISAACVIVVLGISLSILTIRSRNKLTVSKITKDTVTVWLVASKEDTEGKEDEALSDETEEDDKKGELTKLLEENIENSCPVIILEVKEIPESDYADALKEAMEKDELPDVFCTDYLESEPSEVCADLKKLLYTIDKEEYYYFDQLKKDMAYEVPTGIQIAIAYENYGKYQAEGKELDETIKIEDISKIPVQKRSVMGEYEAFGDTNSPVSIIAGDLSCFEQISEVTVRAVPSQEFAAVPIVDEKDQLAAVFCGHYGVKEDNSENRKNAAMICLSFLLNEEMQEEAYLKNYRALPVQRDALDQYRLVKLNGYLEFVREYLNHLDVVENGSGIAETYYDDLAE